MLGGISGSSGGSSGGKAGSILSVLVDAGGDESGTGVGCAGGVVGVAQMKAAWSYWLEVRVGAHHSLPNRAGVRLRYAFSLFSKLVARLFQETLYGVVFSRR